MKIGRGDGVAMGRVGVLCSSSSSIPFELLSR
jgi:hypothetical protein